MSLDVFTNASGSILNDVLVKGNVTVQSDSKSGNTGISFDNGLIVSDGFGNLIANSFIGTGSSGALTVANWVGFGADPTGVKDSTSAIQAAMDSVKSGGGIAYGPPGTYKTSAALVFNGDSIILAGAGWSTIIKPVSGANFDVISTPIPSVAGASGFTRNYIGIRDLFIDCSLMSGTTAGQGNAIHLYGSRYGHIYNVFVNNCNNWAILSDGDNTAPGSNFGYDNKIFGCVFDLCAANIWTTNSEANDIVECRFKYCVGTCSAAQPAFGSQDTLGYHIRNSGGYMYIAGNILGKGGSYTTPAILTSNSGPCRIIGNRFDQVRYQAITLNGGNHMFAFNQLGTPSEIGSGNAVQVGSSNNIIIGNKYDNTAGAITYTWAIAESGGPFSGNIYALNSCLAGTSGTILLTAGSTAVIYGNTHYHDIIPSANITKVSNTYQVLDSDDVVLTDSSGGTFTVTLPNARSGAQLSIKDYTGSAAGHNVTLNTLGGATIDGAASGTPKLTSNYQYYHMLCDGTNWFTY